MGSKQWEWTFSIPAGATVVLHDPGGLAKTVDAVDQLRLAAAQSDASANAVLGGGSDWTVVVDDSRAVEFKLIALEIIEAYGTGHKTVQHP